MKKIYIMRHAEASYRANSDRERNLTKHGLLQATQQGKLLSSFLKHFDAVYVSPFTRTQQTFAQIRDIFETQHNVNLGDVSFCLEDLAPYGNPINVANAISKDMKVQNMQCIFIISHIPLVEDLVSLFCENSSVVNFYPATFVELNLAHDQWILQNIYPTINNQ